MNTKKFITTYLQKLNLTPKEALIFYTLLEHGKLTILEISRASGIERTRLYTLTEKMIQKNLLIKQTEYNKKYLIPCNIEHLELLIEKQEQNIASVKEGFDEVKQFITNIQKTFNPTKVLFYRDKAGIKQMLWNELQAEKEVFSFTYRHLAEITGVRFAKKISAEFDRRGITQWDIESQEFKNSITKSTPPDMFTTKGKFIPKDILDLQIALDTYNDVVSIFNWYKGEVFGVEIYNDKFANLIKQFHKIIWDMGNDDIGRTQQ